MSDKKDFFVSSVYIQSKKISSGVAAFVLVAFLYINIVTMQQISSIYANISHEDNASVVDFFKRAKTLVEFESIRPEVSQTFSLLEDKVYAEDRERIRDINSLEELLKTNPKSRDVLYALAVLYTKEGNTTKASDYLKRAQYLDPKVEI